MALTEKVKEVFRVAMANDDEAEILIEEIEKIAALGEVSPMGDTTDLPAVMGNTTDLPAALGATTNMTALVVAAASIPASNFTAGNAAEPTKAEVDAGIDTLKTAVVSYLDVKADNVDVETLRAEAEARLDAAEAKLDAVRDAAEARLAAIEAKVDAFLTAAESRLGAIEAKIDEMIDAQD